MTKHDETSTSWSVSCFLNVSHQFNLNRWRSLHQLALHKVLNRKTFEACINFGLFLVVPHRNIKIECHRMLWNVNTWFHFRGGIYCDCHLRGCLWVLNCGLRSSWCPNKPTHKSAMQIFSRIPGSKMRSCRCFVAAWKRLSTRSTSAFPPKTPRAKLPSNNLAATARKNFGQVG